MIRIEDLQEAIAECEGQRNPNANTCLKLASLYTILDHKQTKEKTEQKTDFLPVAYSYAAEPETAKIDYKNNTEFAQTIDGMETDRVLEIVDELMGILKGMVPRLYDGVIIKLQKAK